jgi:26S proteasome regulatory subunit N3
MNAFHQRIEFCLKVHNEAVKAMRYPPKKYTEELETAQVKFNSFSSIFIILFF